MSYNKIKKSIALGISILLITTSMGLLSAAQSSGVDTVTSATQTNHTSTSNTQTNSSTGASTNTTPSGTSTTTTKTPPVKVQAVTTFNQEKIVLDSDQVFSIMLDGLNDYTLSFNAQLKLTSIKNITDDIVVDLSAYKDKSLDQLLPLLKSSLLGTSSQTTPLIIGLSETFKNTEEFQTVKNILSNEYKSNALLVLALTHKHSQAIFSDDKTATSVENYLNAQVKYEIEHLLHLKDLTNDQYTSIVKSEALMKAISESSTSFEYKGSADQVFSTGKVNFENKSTLHQEKDGHEDEDNDDDEDEDEDENHHSSHKEAYKIKYKTSENHDELDD